MQDFPAGVIAGIEVYKSGTSDLIEPGLGGLINLRSRRPFDVKDTEIAGEVRGSYNTQSKAYDPSANLVVTKRWDTAIGEIGALANVSFVRMIRKIEAPHRGVRLPTERCLAQELRIARVTVRKALTDLEREGIIQRRQGAGTYFASD